MVDLLQNLGHHGLHIGKVGADHSCRNHRLAVAVPKFCKGVQGSDLLVVVVADSADFRFQKCELLGGIGFYLPEISALDTFDEHRFPDVFGPVTIPFQQHLGIEFIKLCVREPDGYHVFLTLLTILSPHNTSFQDRWKRATSERALPAAGARDWPAGPRVRSTNAISQFAPKVKPFLPFGLHCKDSKLLFTFAKYMFTENKILLTFVQNYKNAETQKCKTVELQKCKKAKVQKCNCVKMQECKNVRI